MLVRIFGLGLFTAFAMLAACSSSEDTPSAAAPPPSPSPVDDAGTLTPALPPSEAGAANQAQACHTLPRTFSVKPTDFFVVFASNQAAIDVYKDVVAPAKLLPAGNEFQARGEEATDKAIAAFRTLYPAALDGMTTRPRVMIVDDPAYNAFALDGATRNGWVFFFNKGAFSATADQLALLTAHELGHLILRNGNDRFFKTTYYRETPDQAGKIFGEYEANDSAIEKVVSTIVKLGGRSGRFVENELNGWPTLYGREKPLYYKHIDTLFTKYLPAAPKPSCAQFDVTEAAITKIVSTSYDRKTQKLVFGADAAKMDGLTKQSASQLADCFSTVKVSFVTLAAQTRTREDLDAKAEIAALNNDRAKIVAYLELLKTEDDYDAANPDLNIATKLFALGTSLQDVVRNELAKPELKADEIRTFTAEDDSDEAAVRVAKLTKQNADELMNGLIGGVDPMYLSTCNALVAKGEIPAYGGFFDPHHADCWRQYRNARLKTALQSCSSAWPASP